MREVAQNELETIQSQRPSDTDPECLPTVGGHSIRPGMELGVYKIRRLLGKGGIGEVWLAWEEVGGFYVVIKNLPPLAQSPDSMKAVLAVFHRVRQLQHPHICPVYTLGFEPDIGYFFAMRYVEGITVDRWLQSVPVAERTRSIIPILHAVAAAYELITGQLPFSGSAPLMICARAVNDAVPEIPGASSDLQAVLCRVLAKKRAERFDSCSEFVTALARAPSVHLR